jgi:RHS repeat-associated protein
LIATVLLITLVGCLNQELNPSYDARSTREKGSYRVEGIGGILYTLRNGVPSYTHYNSRGDVVAKTSSTGAITYEALYEAYGKRTVETGATLDRQKANTKDEDPTGLLNEGYRYRDLDTGTFITRDPLGMVDGPNEYTYVRDNPWTHFDPEGLATEDDLKPIQQQTQRALKEATTQYNHIANKADKATAKKEVDRLQKQLNNVNDRISNIENSAKMLRDAASTEEFLHHGEDDLSKTFNRVANHLDDETDTFKNIQTFRNSMTGLAIASMFTGVGEEAGAAVKGAQEVTTVIGRTKDLQELGAGEQSLLDRLSPNLGSPQENWARNSGVLRSEMNRGLPIRDASPTDTKGVFLNAERNLLQDRGWKFDKNTNFWNPPKQ